MTGLPKSTKRWLQNYFATKQFCNHLKVNKLVYYEVYTDVRDSIAREKQLQNWKREWKIQLIEKDNPAWRDLFDDL